MHLILTFSFPYNYSLVSMYMCILCAVGECLEFKFSPFHIITACVSMYMCILCAVTEMTTKRRSVYVRTCVLTEWEYVH